jgi:FkbM family methyltransferase
MSQKPKPLFPPLVKRVARRLLPDSIYRRYFGRHEDSSLYLWQQLAVGLASSEAVLDIGAFEGEYSLAAREVNPVVPVYAFEPNPLTVKYLRTKCDSLDIEVVESAIAENNGTVTFALMNARSQMTDKTEDSSEQQTVEVRAVTLDTWCIQSAVAPALIKIDTEGAESGILRGGARIVAEYRPVILCEVLSDEAGKDVMEALPPSYRYYHIDENSGRVDQRTTITRKVWRNHNWLLIPPAKMPEMLIS